MPRPKKLRPYTVIRVIEERYNVEAVTKAHALELAGRHGDPSRVTVRSEKAIFEGGNPLPPGYVAVPLF